MSSLRDLSIRNKLLVVIVWSTVFSLATAFTVIGIVDVNTLKREMVDTTVLIAQAIGEYSVSDLAFGTPRDSEDTLR
jgi:hypothetical protein